MQASAAEIDGDKGPEMKAHRKALGVMKISLPFNRLGPDQLSQDGGVDE